MLSFTSYYSLYLCTRTYIQQNSYTRVKPEPESDSDVEMLDAKPELHIKAEHIKAEIKAETKAELKSEAADKQRRKKGKRKSKKAAPRVQGLNITLTRLIQRSVVTKADLFFLHELLYHPRYDDTRASDVTVQRKP